MLILQITPGANTMKIAKTALIFLAGLLIGAVSVHQRTVSAQSGVTVRQVRTNGANPLVDGTVVGFSCVSSGQGDADCYVATR